MPPTCVAKYDKMKYVGMCSLHAQVGAVDRKCAFAECIVRWQVGTLRRLVKFLSPLGLKCFGSLVDCTKQTVIQQLLLLIAFFGSAIRCLQQKSQNVRLYLFAVTRALSRHSVSGGSMKLSGGTIEWPEATSRAPSGEGSG